MTEWQPIETAPLGDPGPDILVWTGWSMDVAHHAWDDEGQPVFFNGDVRVAATHWMPLPEPPSATVPKADDGSFVTYGTIPFSPA